jgi:hypothetical protein
MKLGVNGVSTTFGLAYWDYSGFTQINKLITGRWTACLAQYTIDHRRNTDSKILYIASCTAYKPILLVVKKATLV